MYQHPNVEYPAHLKPGQVVEHRDLPGVPLTVVSGPEVGVTGDVYRVTWQGREVKVKRKNLII